MFRISITEPCREKWTEMSPAEQGVYCGSCCKNVTDFSAMSDAEIVGYLETRKGQKLCGRLRNDQLNRPIFEVSPLLFSAEIPLWKKFLAALFICFSSFITGCSSPGERDYSDSEVPAVTNQPTIPVSKENTGQQPAFYENILDQNTQSSILKIDDHLTWGVISTDPINDKGSPEEVMPAFKNVVNPDRDLRKFDN